MTNRTNDIEIAVKALANGEPLPEGYDLPAVIEAVLENDQFESLGRLTARYLLERNLTQLLARRTFIMASIGKPPCH